MKQQYYFLLHLANLPPRVLFLFCHSATYCTVCDHHHYTTINPFLKAPSLPFHQLANPIMSTLPLAFLLFTHYRERERDRCFHRGKKVYLYARFCLIMQCGGELSKLLLLRARPGVADSLLESRAEQQSALLSYYFWETHRGRIS